MNAARPLYEGFDLLFGDDAARWAAVRGRDLRADGLLYYAVRTTRVYCRPICPARRPRREHVAFFASCEAAEAAGYRACRICRPREAARPRRGDGWSVRPAAILFVDIKGFSRLAARLEPAEAFALVADFHARLGSAVAEHGGKVKKHLGDGLMALFGDAVSHPADAARAIAAGFAMLEALALSSTEPPVAVGIGVNYGMVAIAEEGSREVIGDAVNVASRLERLTRRLGVAMAVSGDALRAASPPHAFAPRLLPIGNVRLPGCRPRQVWVAAAASAQPSFSPGS
ncbi:MAG TPA: Ada metal-binding domain-containing protein [Stellaceae bacterium]|nr:Ada metal-binding domain-containing protein [Stellaceae bacterium]